MALINQARKRLVQVLLSDLDKKRVMAESKQQQGKKAMMDLLIEAEDEDGQKLEDENIADLIFALLSAGFESSALATRDIAMLGPNGRKQNIKYIKHGFEFSCSIFVQYFLDFTKNTFSLFKFLLNFDSFCEFLSGF